MWFNSAFKELIFSYPRHAVRESCYRLPFLFPPNSLRSGSPYAVRSEQTQRKALWMQDVKQFYIPQIRSLGICLRPVTTVVGAAWNGTAQRRPTRSPCSETLRGSAHQPTIITTSCPWEHATCLGRRQPIHHRTHGTTRGEFIGTLSVTGDLKVGFGDQLHGDTRSITLSYFVKDRPSKIEVNSFHLVVCLTTGPMPLPKRALRIVRSKASSFKWEYPLLSLRSSNSFLRLLPRIPVTSIPPCIFPSVTRCRRQFVRKMWPIHFAFRLRISCKIFLCSLTLSSTSSFLTWSVQLIFSTLLQHHISKLSRCF